MKKNEKMTKHGSERVSERLVIKSAGKKTRQVKLAYERGIGRNNSIGVSKKLIDYIVYTENKEGFTEVRIYDGALYLFGKNGALITAWKLDAKYNKLYEAVRRKANKRSNPTDVGKAV